MSANYTYSVVSHNGAGVMAKGFTRCADAKRAAERLAERDAASRVKLGPFEIERIEHLGHGRRYWMRQRSRWVPWNPRRDMDARNPDWAYGGGGAK